MILAHHPMVTALPFVVPAVLVVALLAAVIWRDRRSADHGGYGDGSDR